MEPEVMRTSPIDVAIVRMCLVVSVCYDLLLRVLSPSIHATPAYLGARLLWVIMCIHSSSC